MRSCGFLNSPVRRGYIRKVIVLLVQKYFPHDFGTDIISCSKQKKESDENKINTRQRQYRDETVLLLATR